MNNQVKYILLSLVLIFCGVTAWEVLFLEKHPHFPVEQFPAFYGVISFCSFVLLVIGAKYFLRPLVFRKDPDNV